MAITPGANPLTDAHLDQLNAGIEAANEGLRQAELAQRAGIDVTQVEADIRATLERLRQIKQVYFPGR